MKVKDLRHTISNLCRYAHAAEAASAPSTPAMQHDLWDDQRLPWIG